MRGRRRIEVLIEPTGKITPTIRQQGFTYYLRHARLVKATGFLRAIYTLPGVPAFSQLSTPRMDRARRRIKN